MRSPRAVIRPRLGLLRAASLVLCPVLGLACGEEERPPDPMPTAAETRSFYGLTPGSCVRYRFSQSGIDLFATAEISGPDTSAVAGRAVYRRVFRLPSGGLADEEFIEAQDDGELRLVRFDGTVETNGSDVRQSKQYPEGEEPLLLSLDYDDMMALEAEERVVVTTTPVSQSQGDPEAEEHRVTVLDRPTLESVPYASGPVEGLRLDYTRSVGTMAPVTTISTIVPGSGIARITGENNTTYVACDWRICDANGESCTGAPSCAQLSCN